MQGEQQQETGGIAPGERDAGASPVFHIIAQAVSDGTTFTGGPVTVYRSCIVWAMALVALDGRDRIPLDVTEDGAKPNEIGFRSRVSVPVTFTITKDGAEIAGATVEQSDSGHTIRIG